MYNICTVSPIHEKIVARTRLCGMKGFGSPLDGVWGVQETVYCKYVRREMRTLTTEDKEAFFDVRAQPEQRGVEV